MKAADFRRIALGMQGAVEGAHMGHPDFRAHGRIFATLHSDNLLGMLKLAPEQQQEFVADHPTMFTPENGAWGRQGCTRVVLASADADTVGEAMTMAWRNVATAPPQPPRSAKARSSPTQKKKRSPRRKT